MSHYKSLLLFFSIIAIGAFFRFYNLNWDQGYHLHPDERFLTMVGNAMKIPSSFSEYLNPQISQFNPVNIGYSFFVYGIFPIVLNKFIAVWREADTYNDFTIQGRFLSAFFDLLIIIFVFKIVELFEREYNLDKKVKYLASFFYAIAVLPIQLSHFFAVDTFLNFFMILSFYFSLRFYLKKEIISFILSSTALGFGIGSKISAVFIIPMILCILTLPFLKSTLSNFLKVLKKNQAYFSWKREILDFGKTIGILTIYGFLTYFALRIADPYYFEPGNFFDPKISRIFSENIKILKSFENPDALFPPAVQWINKPAVIFALINLCFFGVGIPYFLFVLIGFYLILKQKKWIFIFIFGWLILFFFYQSSQFAKTMRYFIFIYPFLAIFAGIGFFSIAKGLHKICIIILILLILVWPLSFFSIYTRDHSRVEASYWIYDNLPNQSYILSEHWDDPLPLLVPNNRGKSFTGEQLPIFDQDTNEKWQKMTEALEKGDYYILSSNRGWESIPTVPDKYPLMSKFYNELLSGKLNYQKMKEFTSYPSLRYFGIPLEFPDDFADESFTVYEHPKVLIFRNAQSK